MQKDFLYLAFAMSICAALLPLVARRMKTGVRRRAGLLFTEKFTPAPRGVRLRAPDDIAASLPWDSGLLADFRKKHLRMESTTCGEPAFAEMIALLGFDFLMQTLEMPAAQFRTCYGAASPAAERRALKDVVRKHYLACSHCRSVNQAHEWLDERVDPLFRPKSDVIDQMLERNPVEDAERLSVRAYDPEPAIA